MSSHTVSTGQPSPRGTRFSPDFPVTCPFVTAVGATQINPGSTVNDPEGACEQVIFSGGGFSDFFALPDYQATAVTSFLTNHPFELIGLCLLFLAPLQSLEGQRTAS